MLISVEVNSIGINTQQGAKKFQFVTKNETHNIRTLFSRINLY